MENRDMDEIEQDTEESKVQESNQTTTKNSVELNADGGLKDTISTGINNGTINSNVFHQYLEGKGESESRKGLPIKFYSDESVGYEKYELEEQIHASQELVSHENLSVISCVDRSMLNVIVNNLANSYKSLGYEVQEMFFEDYDRTSITQIIEDIQKQNFQWKGKLLLFIRNSGTYGKDRLPQSLRDLNKIESSQVSSIIGQLKENECKIVYFSASNSYTKNVFKQLHIEFLIPFLTFHDKLDELPTIQEYIKEGRIPQPELELMDCLNWALLQDEFKSVMSTYEVNKKIFEDAIKKGGIYPYVLFVGTFYRGLEFDEFQAFLFLLVEQVETKKDVAKLKAQWNNKADKILQKTGLDYANHTNFRVIDFSQEVDAESCKNLLLKKKRVFVDRLANVIASPTFFFYQNFRHTTTQKMNAFIAIFGQAYGRYYKHEVPFRFLDLIEEVADRLKKLRRPKLEAQYDNNLIKEILQKCKSLKNDEGSIHFYRSISLIQINHPQLKEAISELPYLKYLMRQELALPDSFSLQQVIQELKIVKEKAEQVVDYTNQQWNIANSEYNYLVRRFSALLIELELDADSAQVVDLLLDEALDKQGKYNCIFQVLNEIHYRSDKQVLSWYIKSLNSTKKSERERAFWGVFELLSLDSTNFHTLFLELIDQIRLNKKDDSFSMIEKQLSLTIFLNFYSQTPKEYFQYINSPNEAEEDNELVYQQSIFNTDIKHIEEFLPRLIEFLIPPDFKEIYTELFPIDDYFQSKSSEQMIIQIFFFWYEIINGQQNDEIKNFLIETIKCSVSEKQTQRKFYKALKELRSDYNQKIIDSTNIDQRNSVTLKRNKFVQFINLIQ